MDLFKYVKLKRNETAENHPVSKKSPICMYFGISVSFIVKGIRNYR